MDAARRRIAVVTALGALLAPWCALAAVVAHLVIIECHHVPPHPGANPHVAGVPEHCHVLVQATPRAVMPRPLALVLGASVAPRFAPVAGVAFPRDGAGVGMGLGPPGPERLPTVLRI